MFGKGKVEEGSEPDFMGPRFMGHPGFLKPFRALNASPLELCLKSQQAEDARGVCVFHTSRQLLKQHGETSRSATNHTWRVD